MGRSAPESKSRTFRTEIVFFDHLLFQSSIGGYVGDGEIGVVAHVHSERVVDEGVVLVRAGHFAACHLFDLPLRLIGNAVIVLLIPEQCLSEYQYPM